MTSGVPSPPVFELDHVFICTSAGAPEAARLAALGLTEGEPNAHPGQGTANRRFFFKNAYVELLWVCDEVEAGSEKVRATRLKERWSGRGGEACPFGFCFRPASAQGGVAPFPVWEYQPPYLPRPLGIQVATNSDTLTEPMLCYLDFARRPDSHPPGRRQPLEHAGGFRELTRVEFITPHASSASPTLRQALGAGSIRLRLGEGHLLELGFDREVRGQKADLRPELPAVLFW